MNNLTGSNSMDKPRVFSVTVPDVIYQELRKIAFDRDEKLSAVVRRMLREALPKKKK